MFRNNLYMNMINVFSSSGKYLAIANVSSTKLIVLYMLYKPSVCNKSHCIVYCSLLKSTDLTNREKAFKYLFTRSLLVVGQAGPGQARPGQATALRQPLCVVSRSFFEIAQFYIDILNVRLTVRRHCRTHRVVC